MNVKIEFNSPRNYRSPVKNRWIKEDFRGTQSWNGGDSFWRFYH